MTPVLWNPEVLGNVSVVGLVVFGAGFFIFALMRGWIVLGRHHREVVADRDVESAELRKALATSTETANMLFRALIEKNVTDDTVVKLLTTVREIAQERA